MGWIYVSWFMVTSVGISDKLGKWFGLTASCRDRVYVRVRGERSRQGTRSGEQVVVGCWRPRPARDSEKRVWNAREGVVGMMRALDRRPQRPRALSALALRRPGLAGTLPPLLTAPWRRFGCWIFPPVASSCDYTETVDTRCTVELDQTG